MAKSEPKCRICDGSGRMVLRNSAFNYDGFKTDTCHVCGGTGKSSYNDPQFAKEQKRLRALKAEFSPQAA